MAQIFSYSGSLNIGDAIQTVALSRLLDNVEYVDRKQCNFDPSKLAVVNGWLGKNAAPNNSNVLFAGIHLAENFANVRWIRQSKYPVGSRDPYTQKLLKRFGIESELVRCATLTLERYNGPRSGELFVDVSGPGKIKHNIDSDSTWEQQLNYAKELLTQYSRAELVTTRRLHVFLPCLALGTPVILKRPSCDFYNRFSLLKDFDVEFDKPIVRDVSEAANTYKAFLSSSILKN